MGDFSCYMLFDFIDVISGGDVNWVLCILCILCVEGVEVLVVLWVLGWEICVLDVFVIGGVLLCLLF